MNYIEQLYANHKKSFKIVMRSISILIWMALFALIIYSALNGRQLMIVAGGEVLVTFYLLAALLMAGLYGYLISLISFFGAFITIVFLNTDFAYCSVIYLVGILCFSLFSQYFWFNSVKKTFLACTITLGFVGLIENLCITVIASDNYSIETAVGSLHEFLIRNLIVVYGVGFFLYLYFTKLPDAFKLPFPLAVGYTKNYQENYALKRQLRKTKVSVKITTIIIIVELLLGIAVGVYMVVLFPDIKDMLAGSIRRGEFVMDLPEVVDAQTIAEGVENMEYDFNGAALSFDIKMIFLMLCIGVPMAAFANFYTKMTIGQPLGLLSDFMDSYANAEDKDKLKVGKCVDKLPIKTNDEINIVYESIRSTVHEIENYINRIQEEQKLESELEIAKKSSEAKSNFLSNMSHEIRTPINAIIGMDEMILRESDDDQIIEYATNVKSASNSLLSIVNDILDFSKIEAGKMEILPVQYNLDSLINDLVNMISTKATDKGLELEVNVDNDIPDVLIGDEIRIKQCVTNVLTNAVKYTEKGKVTLNVSYKKLNDINIGLIFQVVDTGIGIKEEDLSKLFSPFERIEEIRNRSIEGTGLGMSIVKRMLALMDTKLVVKSVYGQGSDFSFEVKQQVVSWEPVGDFKEKYKDFIKSAEKYHQKFEAKDARILVVDDTEINLTVIKNLLKRTLINIDTATSGFETLDKVKENKYHVIFLDHRMPQMDGVETFEAMKTLEGNLNVNVPVIALTANALSGAKEEYLSYGFTDYLSKPINGVELEEMLIRYLPKDLVEIVDKADDTREDDNNIHQVNNTDSYLSTVENIDVNEAINNCGGVDFAENVVRDFYNSIDERADAIEQFYKESDIKNYTVLVHALKSSARLIGALELSKMAEELEAYGNDNNIDKINELTGPLLERYRSYKTCLKACEVSSDKDKPLIDEEGLISAFKDINELVEAFDFDSAESIFEMLENYTIPEDYKNKYDNVKKLLDKVDREGVLKELKI